MGDSNISESMLDVFIYESETLLESMEQLAMENEETEFDEAGINEMFRSMHTIKGSSAIMMYNNITTTSHKLEDIFYCIRESHPEGIPQKKLVDLVLKVTDFIKGELDKIKLGEAPDGDETELMSELEAFLNEIKNGTSDEAPAKETTGEAPAAAEASRESAPATNKAERYTVIPENCPDSHFYIIQVYFKSYVEMQNIKAYTMVYSLQESAQDMYYEPDDIMTSEESGTKIANDGFFLAVQTAVGTDDLMTAIDHVGGTSNIEINEVTIAEYAYVVNRGSVAYLAAKEKGEDFEKAFAEATAPAEAAEPVVEAAVVEEPKEKKVEEKNEAPAPVKTAPAEKPAAQAATKDKAEASKQAFISVNVSKMDALMDLIGELVIAEAVVLQNPDLNVPGLDLTNFQKAAAQLQKISGELQDVIMAMRMMPLSNTFQKMKRIVHDVSGKLEKQVELQIIGEDTEVDKNIIEHISDPLMHLIRNSVDHGIESAEERAAAGKPEKGRIVLEAKNEGGKVWISVSDDGKGLNREKIYNKALEQGLIIDPQKEYTDKEVYSFITKPGFSTKEAVTEYSGRGVGMDVVVQNIQNIGGSLDIESIEGEGSRMTLKIPLTLAIIDGIIFGVGTNRYVVATGNVKEFLSASQSQIVKTPEGAESIMLRGECYPILRLKDYYNLKQGKDDIEQGIVTIIEHEGKNVALFVDELIGEQEIVVKPIPKYIGKIKGLSGCTQLGDGSISLILDAGSLIKD